MDATHDFLSAEDRIALETFVSGLRPNAPLQLAVDDEDRPIAFMLINRGHIEALFVDPAYHRTGVGTALVRHGLALDPEMTTDVNEQNPLAISFYEKMGFRSIGRSPLDGQGRPYPLIHMAFVDQARKQPNISQTNFPESTRRQMLLDEADAS